MRLFRTVGITLATREHFYDLMKMKRLNTLSQSQNRINVTSIDITGFDFRKISLKNFQKITFSETQDFTGCLLTVEQANHLANTGICTVRTATIKKRKKTDTLVAKALQNGCKISITANELENILRDGNINDLESYYLQPDELKKTLERLNDHTSVLHYLKPDYLFKKFIPFIRAEAEKIGIKKITLSNKTVCDVNLDGCDLKNIVMEKCDFANSNFGNTHCEQTEFLNCSFRYCAFEKMYMSQNTVFQKPNFIFKNDARIETVYYQQDGKNYALNPAAYYCFVKTKHQKLVTEQKKSIWRHDFFYKTNKALEKPNRFSLTIIFSCFLEALCGKRKLEYFPDYTKSFIGTLRIHAQVQKNPHGITTQATVSALPFLELQRIARNAFRQNSPREFSLSKDDLTKIQEDSKRPAIILNPNETFTVPDLKIYTGVPMFYKRDTNGKYGELPLARREQQAQEILSRIITLQENLTAQKTPVPDAEKCPAPEMRC